MINANLINLKVINDNEIQLEILFKTKIKESKIIAYLKMDNKKKYFNVKRETFSNEIDYVKLSLTIKLNQYGTFKFVIEEDNKVYNNIKFLDNKDEEICELPILYTIFARKISIKIDNKNANFIIEKKKIFDEIKYEIKKIILAYKKYKKLYLLYFFKRKEKYILLNDRIMYGDDNAEALFQYINNNDKKMRKYTYFVLEKESPNYKRIKKIGKVLKYKSILHKIKYLNAKLVVSSHASYYDRVFNPFTDQEMSVYKNLVNKQFVFLQHGIIMNDVHNMLNREHIIADLFVTSTQKEYDEVKEKYLYEENQVICTGLSRFDKLIDNRKNIILIAPTWRTFLTSVEYGNNKEKLFEESEFFQKYKSILQNKDFLNVLKEKKYKIKFLLHPAFEEYKKYFMSLENDVVKIYSTKEVSYNTLFKECKLFITDYSSTHFDVAFLKKAIIYYQFDLEKFYKSHYLKGYFDYSQDGFGEVIKDEEKLINKIIFYINNNCKIEEKYKNKIEKTFKYIDYNNSKRILNEIKKIQKENEKNYRFNKVH